MNCFLWLGSHWEIVRRELESQRMPYSFSVTQAPNRNLLYSGDLRVVRWNWAANQYNFVLAYDNYSRVSGRTP